MDRDAEERFDKLEERLRESDHRILATRKLVLAGMKLLTGMERKQVEMQENQVEMQEKINALIDAQMRTDAQIAKLGEGMQELRAAQQLTERSLKAFIDSLNRGSNGH